LLAVNTGFLMKTDDEIQELVSYVKWYGGFNDEETTIQWMDKHLGSWRTVRNTKIIYSERISKD